VEEVAEVMTQGLSTPAGVILITLGTSAGVAVGYFVAEKRLRTKYERIAEEEISNMRDHFRARLVARESPKPDLDGLKEKVEELGYDTPAQPNWPPSDPPIPVPDEALPELEIEDEVDTLNVFERSAEWNQEAEDEARDPKKPYVIHVDERHEADHDEVTFTYYAGDDVLCDGGDRIISEVDEVIGIENLDRFGHGSDDPNVVYVRNMQLAADIEVIKSEGTYAEEVQGMKHSDAPRARPPRWDG
jgi:hypothetical protein